MDELNMDCQDVEKFYPTIVKGFNNKKLQEAFITTPNIVCDYISALHRALDMSEETNKKAVAKIKELSKAIDVFYNSERKTIVDLHEANLNLKVKLKKKDECLKVFDKAVLSFAEQPTDKGLRDTIREALESYSKKLICDTAPYPSCNGANGCDTCEHQGED